jgi:gas vesicle protein
MRSGKIEKLEGETVETQWDIKRIVIGIVILAILASFGALFFFPKKPSSDQATLGVSSGESSRELPNLPTQDDVENIVSEAKSALSEITSENLTSSQAAIQKIISDLQKLQENKGAIGAICSLICKE